MKHMEDIRLTRKEWDLLDKVFDKMDTVTNLHVSQADMVVDELNRLIWGYAKFKSCYIGTIKGVIRWNFL